MFALMALITTAASTQATAVTILYELRRAERTVLGPYHFIQVKELVVTEPNKKVVIEREDLRNHFNEVSAISIENNICHYLPRGFEKYFQHINIIAVINSELKVITRRDLQAFPALERLFLNNNRLTKIEPKLFAANRHLRLVEFNNNRIREISPDLFDYFHLDCRINFITNACITRNTKELSIKAVTSEILRKCQKSRQEIADNCALMSEKWFGLAW